MPTAPVNDWGAAIITSAAAALALFMAAIPKILGFLVILVIGWLIAGAISNLVARLLRTVRFNEMAQRAGLSSFIQNMGVHTDASGMVATVVRWFARLIVLVVAFDALGLPAVSSVLQQFLLWIPNLIVAMVILVIAGLAANALAGIVRGATAQAGLGNPDLLSNIARYAVWGFGIVVAVNQIGIASTLVNTLFMGLVATLTIAFGLAFGLGGRDTAAEIVRNWYRNGQEAAPRVQRAANAMQNQSNGEGPRDAADIRARGPVAS